MNPGNQSAGKSSSELREQFLQRYKSEPRIFRAPGRVNLIGEHTDYNDGFVMPAAIEFYTQAAVAPRNDRRVQVHSIEFAESCVFDLDHPGPGLTGHWSDYVRGVAAVLESAGHKLFGANLMIHGEVPVGAGLSSSAALEVSTALALLANSNLHLDRRDVALACQQAEHRYAGTKCGIMDQFISCYGEAGHALMLDCRSLDYELLAIDERTRIVICNTRVKHELSGGEYNRRRADCEAGVLYLREFIPGIRALRDVMPADLERWGGGMPEVTYRRCRHIVTENTRVLAASQALKSGSLVEFGQLMNASHRSLRDDYEVSCRELDVMVELAQECSGVLGARMTGGGFGGCTVNLVEEQAVPEFKSVIAKGYQDATGLQPEIYVCTAAQGAGEITSARS